MGCRADNDRQAQLGTIQACRMILTLTYCTAGKSGQVQDVSWLHLPWRQPLVSDRHGSALEALSDCFANVPLAQRCKCYVFQLEYRTKFHPNSSRCSLLQLTASFVVIESINQINQLWKQKHNKEWLTHKMLAQQPRHKRRTIVTHVSMHYRKREVQILTLNRRPLPATQFDLIIINFLF